MTPGDRPAAGEGLRPDMLAEIPVVDVGAGGALALLQLERARAERLLAQARRHYTAPVLRLGDRLSALWLSRSANPHAATIAAIAREAGRPGAVMLNVSYEWACTSIAAPDPGGQGNRLLRTLDWPFDGLGANVVVAREAASAGSFLNVTWPGSVGILTAMAPRRFSVALNQAPMSKRGLGIAGDWLLGRLDWWRSTALPPTHLLRTVLETAPSYAAAVAMLRDAPVALPCFFIVSGLAPDQGCVIERRAGGATVHDGAIACANDWLSPGRAGRPRGRQNARRRAAIAAAAERAGDDFAWVVPPVLNERTRLAVSANASTGELGVIGIEASARATRTLCLKTG